MYDMAPTCDSEQSLISLWGGKFPSEPLRACVLGKVAKTAACPHCSVKRECIIRQEATCQVGSGHLRQPAWVQHPPAPPQCPGLADELKPYSLKCGSCRQKQAFFSLLI